MAWLGLALVTSWIAACSPTKPVTSGIDVKPPEKSSGEAMLSDTDYADRLRALDAILKEIPDHEPSLEARIKLRLEHSNEKWLTVHDAKRYASLLPSNADRQLLLAEACYTEVLVGPAIEALSKAIKIVASQPVLLHVDEMVNALEHRSRYRMLLGNPSGALSDLVQASAYLPDQGRRERIEQLELYAGKREDTRSAVDLTWIGKADGADHPGGDSWLYGAVLTRQSLDPVSQTQSEELRLSKPENLRRQAHEAFMSAIGRGLFTPKVPEAFRDFLHGPPSAADIHDLRVAYHAARTRLGNLYTYRLAMRPALLHDPATLAERANRATHWIKLGENNWMYINTGGPDLSQIATLLAWVGVADGSVGGLKTGEPGPKGVLIRDTLPENDSSILYWIGARRGDIIASVNQEAVSSLFEAAAVVTKHIAAHPNQPLHRFEAVAYRNGQPFPVTITTFDPDVPTPIDTLREPHASGDKSGR